MFHGPQVSMETVRLSNLFCNIDLSLKKAWYPRYYFYTFLTNIILVWTFFCSKIAWFCLTPHFQIWKKERKKFIPRSFLNFNEIYEILFSQINYLLESIFSTNMARRFLASSGGSWSKSSASFFEPNMASWSKESSCSSPEISKCLFIIKYK